MCLSPLIGVFLAGDSQLAQRIAVLELGPLGRGRERVVLRGGGDDGRFLEHAAQRVEHPGVVFYGALGVRGNHYVGRGSLLAAHFQHVLVERVLVLGVHDGALAVRAVAAGHGALLGQQARCAVALERDGDGRGLPGAARADNHDVELFVPLRVRAVRGRRGFLLALRRAARKPQRCHDAAALRRASHDAEPCGTGKRHAGRLQERAAALLEQVRAVFHDGSSLLRRCC